MDNDLDDQPRSGSETFAPEKSGSGKRIYLKPVLLRLGTVQDLTRTVGSLGAKDSTRGSRRTGF
ncbi:MAG: hypothetical protein ACK4JB_01255 [Reyranella sp.]